MFGENTILVHLIGEEVQKDRLGPPLVSKLKSEKFLALSKNIMLCLNWRPGMLSEIGRFLETFLL